MTERIADLALEHAAPAGRARSRSVLFVHGMWGGSWYLRNYLYAAAAAGWDAWAVNLRGHGESAAPGGLEGSVSTTTSTTYAAVSIVSAKRCSSGIRWAG